MFISMEKALAKNRVSVDAFLATAADVDHARWDVARAEGKWSPAEIAAHLVTSYDVVTAELRGGNGMAIVTSRWQQLLFRLLFGWRILLLGKFPRGVRAPRETRPPAGLPKDEALATLRIRADEFERAAREAAPGHKLSHAYFGRADAADGVLLVARHIEHHRRQLVES